MVAGDLAVLECMIDDSALYVHTNGVRETKAEYVELVRNGSYRYSQVTQPEMNIRVLADDVAIVTGRTIPGELDRTHCGRAAVDRPVP